MNLIRGCARSKYRVRGLTFNSPVNGAHDDHLSDLNPEEILPFSASFSTDNANAPSASKSRQWPGQSHHTMLKNTSLGERKRDLAHASGHQTYGYVCVMWEYYSMRIILFELFLICSFIRFVNLFYFILFISYEFIPR
jgi:hypothetical protein